MRKRIITALLLIGFLGAVGTERSLAWGGLIIGPGVDLSNYDLSGRNLDNANLENANISKSTLTAASIRVANLRGANLSMAKLSNANLYLTDLSGANLSKANLSGAGLTGANLSMANLQGAYLRDADLSTANLSGVSSGGITGATAFLPSGWSLISGYLIGPNANLSNANLSGAGLTGANLSMANLQGAYLGDADLSNANLYGANLSTANLSGANLSVADLSGANLSTANLSGANLSVADLSGLNLSTANLSDANLTDAIYSTSTLWQAGFDFLQQGALGPGVNLQGENLSSNDLSGIDFTAASFTNCNLSGCNLSGCILIGANFTNAKMTGVNLNNAVIASGTRFPKGFDPVAAGALVLTPAPKMQAITFPSLAKTTFGRPPIRLRATASSKLPVSYVIGNKNVVTLSVSGTDLIILGTGSTTVTALQRGNSDFAWAPPLTRTLVIAKGAQSITFSKISPRTFGQIPFTLQATSSSGLPVTYASSNPRVATVSGNTVTLVGIGNTTITASQEGNSLYNAKSVTQVLTVRGFK